MDLEYKFLIDYNSTTIGGDTETYIVVPSAVEHILSLLSLDRSYYTQLHYSKDEILNQISCNKMNIIEYDDLNEYQKDSLDVKLSNKVILKLKLNLLIDILE